MKTTNNHYLTKKEVEQIFKTEFKDFLKECNTTPKDKPAKREAWNNYIDYLQKDNQINPKSDWVHPKFISN